MINKKKIEHNIDLKKFVHEMITLHKESRYGVEKDRNQERFKGIIKNHLTDKTRSVKYYIYSSHYDENVIGINIVETLDSWRNQYHTINYNKEELIKELKEANRNEIKETSSKSN